jgi:translation elongation factor EF-Tu-like GTPase
MADPADIEAELQFLTTAEGRRKTPCRSGFRNYRAPCDFGVTEAGLNNALFEFIDKEWVSPGERVKTRMWFLDPHFQSSRLYEGFDFTIHEGLRVVARGKVTKVINEALRKGL